MKSARPLAANRASACPASLLPKKERKTIFRLTKSSCSSPIAVAVAAGASIPALTASSTMLRITREHHFQQVTSSTARDNRRISTMTRIATPRLWMITVPAKSTLNRHTQASKIKPFPALVNPISEAIRPSSASSSL